MNLSGFNSDLLVKGLYGWQLESGESFCYAANGTWGASALCFVGRPEVANPGAMSLTTFPDMKVLPCSTMLYDALRFCDQPKSMHDFGDQTARPSEHLLAHQDLGSSRSHQDDQVDLLLQREKTQRRCSKTLSFAVQVHQCTFRWLTWDSTDARRHGWRGPWISWKKSEASHLQKMGV